MSWKTNFIGKIKSTFREDVNGIYTTQVEDSDSYLFHQKYSKGAHLRKLTSEKYHQIYWETPSYIKALEGFLPHELNDKIILDFGCGDGRFIDFLLLRGAKRIICVDFDYNTLLSLKHYADDSGISEKLILVHSDYEKFPRFENEFDIILSIGVLYYLKEKYEEAINNFYLGLKSNGILVTSDPDLEGFLFRGLIFDSLEESIKIFKTRTFKETKEDTPYRFRLFDENEFRRIFSDAGFKQIDKKTISSFHNLLRVLTLRGNITLEELDKHETEIWEIFNYLDHSGKLAKHLIWRLGK